MDERERRSGVQRLTPRDPEDLGRLVEALGDASWRVRAAAVDALASGDPRDVVPRVAALLGERGSVAARDAAAHTLVLIGEPSVEAVTSLLEHRDAGVRKVALDVLGRVGALRSVRQVAARLEDPDPNVRAAAAEALGGMPGEVAGEALRRALLADERLVRAHALEALERLGGEAPLEPMLAAYRDPVLRRRALPLLARRDEREAMLAVVEAVADPARSVRHAALSALWQVFHRAGSARRARLRSQLREVSPAGVQEVLESPDLDAAQGALLVLGTRREIGAAGRVARAADRPELRAAAEHVLRIFGPGCAPALREAYPGLGPGGRVASLRILGRCDDPADHALLHATARGTEPEPVRIAAIRALGHVPGASGALLSLADDPDPALAAAAADALVRLSALEPGPVRAAARQGVRSAARLRVLGRVGDASDREPLHRAVQDPAGDVRAAALEGLVRLADPRAAGALLAALADGDAGVRVAAARGLGAVPPAVDEREIVSALAGALRDPDPSVATAAAEALGDRHAAPGALRAVLREALPRGGAYSMLAIACVRGLGACGDDAGILAAFDSLDPEVVKAAASTAGPGCADALVAALKHPGWDVRRAAEAGLRRNRVRAALRE